MRKFLHDWRGLFSQARAAYQDTVVKVRHLLARRPGNLISLGVRLGWFFWAALGFQSNMNSRQQAQRRCLVEPMEQRQMLSASYIAGPASIKEGVTYTLALSTTSDIASSIHSWSVNWGDGQIQNFSANPSSIQHIFHALRR